MTKFTAMFGVAVAAFALSGCKSDTEKVCAKMAEIAKNDPKVEELGKKMKEEMADVKGCVTKMEEQKKEKPEAFKKASTCIDGASDVEGVIKCFFEAEK